MIQIVGDCIDKAIIKEVRAAGYVSIMMDETTDRSKTEQTSLCLRYVYVGIILERLVKMKSLKRANADTLFNFLTAYFREHGLDMQMIVGQSYDGANVMKGGKMALFLKSKKWFHMLHSLGVVLIDWL